MSEPTPLLTAKEAAVKLRRSEYFVLTELRRKNLRGAKFGGGWTIKEADLESYVEAHMNVAPVRGRSS